MLLLKTFAISIWSTAAELSLSNKSIMFWIAESIPATWPTQTCYESAACTTFFFAIDITDLSMILCNTSPIPTGLTPSDLFGEIKWLERSAFWDHSFFVILANDLRSSKLWLPNTFESRILRQSSPSNFDGPTVLFILMSVFWIKSLVFLSSTTSCISFIGSWKSNVSNLGLATGFFMLSCCLTSSVRFRTPLSRFSESNLSALFILAVLMKCSKFLLMYSGFLFFQLLVFSFFCIANHSLKSAFTFPSFQSSSFLEKCSLLMILEAYWFMQY